MSKRYYEPGALWTSKNYGDIYFVTATIEMMENVGIEMSYIVDNNSFYIWHSTSLVICESEEQIA